MPFPSSTQVPACSPDDTGVVVDAILKSGSKYYGKRVVLIADTSSQEELVSIWANRKPSLPFLVHFGKLTYCNKDVNVKATFKEITGAERKANMKSNGIPEHIAVAVTELSEALAFEKEPMTESSLVQAVDVSRFSGDFSHSGEETDVDLDYSWQLQAQDLGTICQRRGLVDHA